MPVARRRRSRAGAGARPGWPSSRRDRARAPPGSPIPRRRRPRPRGDRRSRRRAGARSDRPARDPDRPIGRRRSRPRARSGLPGAGRAAARATRASPRAEAGARGTFRDRRPRPPRARARRSRAGRGASSGTGRAARDRPADRARRRGRRRESSARPRGPSRVPATRAPRASRRSTRADSARGSRSSRRSTSRAPRLRASSQHRSAASSVPGMGRTGGGGGEARDFHGARGSRPIGESRAAETVTPGEPGLARRLLRYPARSSGALIVSEASAEAGTGRSEEAVGRFFRRNQRRIGADSWVKLPTRCAAREVSAPRARRPEPGLRGLPAPVAPRCGAAAVPARPSRKARADDQLGRAAEHGGHPGAGSRRRGVPAPRAAPAQRAWTSAARAASRS